MPIPTTAQDLDDEVKEIMSKYGMRVMFALRHKIEASKNIEQLDKVFSDNQILLFIPNVYKVDVINEGITRYSVEKDDKKWVVTDFRYLIPEDLRIWVERISIQVTKSQRNSRTSIKYVSPLQLLVMGRLSFLWRMLESITICLQN